MADSLSDVLEAAKDLPKLRTIIVVDGSENKQRYPSGVIHLNTISKTKANGVKFYPNIDVVRDLISLPYSSGTTGKPKGVILR
jgi:long-subunit acyl-CoA synthetase (AMP-forming)